MGTDLDRVPLLALTSIVAGPYGAGSSRSTTFAEAMYIADGNVSFDDWDMLMWSLG
jgi:hypothetical protein